VAGLVVQRRDLRPPVAIDKLLRNYADVEAAPWPYQSVDAVVVNLDSSRPKVFYREDAPPARLRFTLAHELGHVLLAWHTGSAECASGSGDLDLPTYGQEDEADVFASALLVPDRWLASLLDEHTNDMTTILQDLGRARVSTLAALRGLRRALLAGWVFMWADSALASTGTDVDVMSASRSDLREVADDYGSALLNGVLIHWFRMFRAAEIPDADSDARSTTELLKAAIAAVEADEGNRLHRLQSANGRVGGSLQNVAGRSPQELYSQLLYRFPEEELRNQPEFTTWLARKARNLSDGNSIKKNRQRKGVKGT
jgi:hypothetical protein